MGSGASDAQSAAPFSEKDFYLAEFRGWTVALAAPAEQLCAPAPLADVLEDLEANGTRVVLLSSGKQVFATLRGTPFLSADAPRLEGAVWRALRASRRVGICVEQAESFARESGRIAVCLGVKKLVWIDEAGALLDREGRRLSFVDLDQLRAILREAPARGDAGRRCMLQEIEAVLTAGLPAVNLCSLAGLADELFTYAGSGTLFSRERYVTVRRLGIDDFDAAADLIARGVAEGYLAPRTPEEIERVLANGFGAFVEGRHLAGIGALLRHGDEGVGEIASLYTLTRFLGEGIGAHLLTFACDRAREVGCAFITAVTTSERVAGFFERNGFRRVPADELPAEKWRDYDPRRRARVLCLRRDLQR
jgi:N-acetylglutamate synthase-like GNAT family acetyltransferase